MIKLRCVRAWKTLSRRRKRLSAYKKEQAAIREYQMHRYTDAVQTCLAGASGGGVFICPEIKKVDVYHAISRRGPMTKEDMLNHLDWWMIDVSRAFDNYRPMTQREKEIYYQHLFNHEKVLPTAD